MEKILLIIIYFTLCHTTLIAKQKIVMFDLSHGQCNDTYPEHKYYTDVVSDYEMITTEYKAVFKVNESSEIIHSLLKEVDVLIMLSPLSNKLQKNITKIEKKAIIDFIKRGGSLILFIDDEHRVNLKEYGANDITNVFGIVLGSDIDGIPGNCGAIAFENEIFSNRHELPYSGARAIKGGIPSSVCMEGGHIHSTFIKLKNGGKLFVGADTMVGQLMGYNDGKRNIFNRMDTRWWGKDSRQFMEELISWCLK